MSIDPQQMAKEALAKAMIPTPDDIMESLDPLAALYYFEQLGWGVLTLWTAYVTEMDGIDSDVTTDLAETLNGIAVTVGGLDVVCARIGLIPQEAVDGAPS
jgi:hypothetical protein